MINGETLVKGWVGMFAETWQNINKGFVSISMIGLWLKKVKIICKFLLSIERGKDPAFLNVTTTVHTHNSVLYVNKIC